MRTSGTPPGGVRGGPTARAPAPLPGAFAAALARARASPRRGRTATAATAVEAEALARSASALGLVALDRRRRGAAEGHQALGERRSEAEPGGAAGAPRPLEPQTGGAGEAHAADGARAGALWPPAALEALALAARQGERPAIELAMGREVRVTLVRAARGVEVLLDVRSGLRAAAEGELPALVAALRARGVEVARAEVRVPRALTARRGSATTARLQGDGTVAKW